MSVAAREICLPRARTHPCSHSNLWATTYSYAIAETSPRDSRLSPTPRSLDSPWLGRPRNLHPDMPDIDPAALSSRPSVNLSTPVLKSITMSPVTQKITKTSQIIPARIDLEPLYTSLKIAIGPERWNAYKDATTRFMSGSFCLATACVSALSLLQLTRVPFRSAEPGRILRTRRSDPHRPQWRETAPPQPALGRDIWEPDERDARPGPRAVGVC